MLHTPLCTTASWSSPPSPAGQTSHRESLLPSPAGSAHLSSSPLLTGRTVSLFGELAQTWDQGQLSTECCLGGMRRPGLHLPPGRKLEACPQVLLAPASNSSSAKLNMRPSDLATRHLALRPGKARSLAPAPRPGPASAGASSDLMLMTQHVSAGLARAWRAGAAPPPPLPTGTPRCETRTDT